MVTSKRLRIGGSEHALSDLVSVNITSTRRGVESVALEFRHGRELFETRGLPWGARRALKCLTGR